MKTLLILWSVLFAVPALAEMAIETMPGVTFYGDHTLGVETMPGVHVYSGAVSGMAVEILPGMTSYSLNRDAEFVQQLIDQDRQRDIDQRLSQLEYENRRLRQQANPSTRAPWER